MDETSSKRAFVIGMAAAAVSLFGLGNASAPAQSVGFGSSPGRASYRPAGDWNNGPFYTVSHLDPYAPRPAVSTGLIYSDPAVPPYTSEPRGSFVSYYPERSPLFRYEQGFAPFSGYADWFRRTYGFEPTQRDLAQASGAYFRSSPIPADPRYLAPAVSQALSAQAVPTTSTAPNPGQPRLRIEAPRTPDPARKPRGTVLYRGPR